MKAQSQLGEHSFPVTIKINNYFILETHPVSPYLTNKGRIMVTLKTFGPLLGITTTFNTDTHSVIATRDNTSIEFQDRKLKAIKGNQILALDVAPFWIDEREDMVVPLRSVLTAFNIEFEWLSSTTELIIIDTKALQNDAISSFQVLTGDLNDVDSFIPTDVTFSQGTENSNILKVKLKNISRDNTDIEKVTLYLLGNLILGESSVTFGKGLIVPEPTLTEPCQLSGQNKICQFALDSSMTDKDFRYIVGRVGFQKTSQ